MCRGCVITKNGQATTEEYLEWFHDYTATIKDMKAVEKKVLAYRVGIDNPKHINLIDKFRRQLIRTRRDYAKATNMLNDL